MGAAARRRRPAELHIRVRRTLLAGSFEKFLTDKIKVENKTGVLGDVIKVARDKTKVTVTAETALSKRCVRACVRACVSCRRRRGEGGAGATRAATSRHAASAGTSSTSPRSTSRSTT